MFEKIQARLKVGRLSILSTSFPSKNNYGFRNFVTAPLLQRFLCLYSADKVSVIDEAIKEFVPVFGVDASGLDYVFQFFGPVIGQGDDCFIEAGVNSDEARQSKIG